MEFPIRMLKAYLKGQIPVRPTSECENQDLPGIQYYEYALKSELE